MHEAFTEKTAASVSATRQHQGKQKLGTVTGIPEKCEGANRSTQEEKLMTCETIHRQIVKYMKTKADKGKLFSTTKSAGITIKVASSITGEKIGIIQ